MTANDSPKHFIQRIVEEDLLATPAKQLVFRFPPEPNGYLHIGHAKAIYLNFELARAYGGICRLRFDDTNPEQEEVTYVRAIEEDVRWLGYTWADETRYTSDYFSQLYEWAKVLIRMGKAYVDRNDSETFNRLYRGTVTVPGKESPYRRSSVEENLKLFACMKAGAFLEGSATLRAKIDMISTNILLRDPVLYRIKKKAHFKQQDRWCIYPTYDFSHPLSDAVEGVTHSLCTLEFASHRPLYDWLVKTLPVPAMPRQIEFSRLHMSRTITSKHALACLIKDKGTNITSWDDPRLPTLAGMRRRGYTPQAIKSFVEKVGVSKREQAIDWSLLESCLREDLNRRALRRMAVLCPVRLVITNYPADKVELVEALNNPEDPRAGYRKVPFSKHLYIEQEDFMLAPSAKFFRLAVGREVRLKYAYIVRCHEVVQDHAGIQEIHCTYDPESKSGRGVTQKKVKGTLHWVSVAHSQPAEVRSYASLFKMEPPAESSDIPWQACVNPQSLQVLSSVRVEPALEQAVVGTPYQFERQGYFCLDAMRNEAGHPVFHRSVTLREVKKMRTMP